MTRNNGKVILPAERTVERGRGCWNCKHYENGEMSQNRWAERRQQDTAHLIEQGVLPLIRLGDQENVVETDEANARFEMMDKLIRAGTAGLCMKSKVPTDFVHCQYLCDGWNGRDGSSLATAGKPLDKLPGELREMVEEKAKKR
jgi:hypothetical protein